MGAATRNHDSDRGSASSGRNRQLRLLLGVLALGALTALWIPRVRVEAHPPLDLRYSVQIARPEESVIGVELEVSGIEASVLHLGFSANALAASAPVSKFRVREILRPDGSPLQFTREPGVWIVPRPSPSLRVIYEVHLDGAHSGAGSDYAAVALSRVAADGGRLLGSDVFLFPDRNAVNEITVDWDLPAGWDLVHPFQSGERSARVPGLASLYHSAVAVGPYRQSRRMVGSTEIVMAIRGNFAFGDHDLLEVIEQLTQQQIERFGPPRRDRYVFVIDEHPNRDDPKLLHYFGLHFDGSMIVLMDPRTDRRRLRNEPASLCAHEFFHNWLGELLRQKHYDMNWFVEGVTTWYAYQSLLKTRMIDSGRYASELNDRYSQVYSLLSLRDRVSVAQAGQTVLKNRDTTRLLYSGGLFIALTLDEAIDEATHHESNLEDLLARLFERARQEPSFRLTRGRLEAELESLTGEDFGPWFDRHVYGVEEPPLPDYVKNWSR
jgi:predicted metalloprotease with PDZ domain